MHVAYVFKLFNDLFQSENFIFKKGDTFTLPQLTVTIISVAENNMPTELAFVFSTPLEDDSLRFYKFDWNSLSHKPFEIPRIGQTVEIQGPPYASCSDVFGLIRNMIAD